MRSNTVRVAGGVAVVVAAIALLLVLKGGNGGGKSSDAGGRVPTISIRDDKPVDGVRQLTFNKGERIRFDVIGVEPGEEVHFHGYDVMKDAGAGGSVSFDVPATLEGVFEAELEGHKEQIAEITVNP
jgi:hypothetical protein